jgi:hypothetical protein
MNTQQNNQVEQKKIYIKTNEKGLEALKNLMKVVQDLTGEKGEIIKIEKLETLNTNSEEKE